MRDDTLSNNELKLQIKKLERNYEELVERYKKLQMENIKKIVSGLKNKKPNYELVDEIIITI
jgi:hypothetical protein|tara:strand:+ start:566 stop:751 length:186 start_codon:yes stop_codon:yes gene_type:complete